MYRVTLDTDSVARKEVVTEATCSTEDSGTTCVAGCANMDIDNAAGGDPADSERFNIRWTLSVSYTHLTLPTMAVV